MPLGGLRQDAVWDDIPLQGRGRVSRAWRFHGSDACGAVFLKRNERDLERLIKYGLGKTTTR
jgi:hypothetical protein